MNLNNYYFYRFKTKIIYKWGLIFDPQVDLGRSSEQNGDIFVSHQGFSHFIPPLQNHWFAIQISNQSPIKNSQL